MSCQKIHLRTSFSLLEEATKFLDKMSWYWVKFMKPMTLTRAPGPVEVQLQGELLKGIENRAVNFNT
uniref:Hm2 protein n=1 Tax=Schistosoma japonicum TaxID=6182 RepID=Q8MQU2_SCHJA|nr:Hm2 protein [Schistosoma japonicum]